VFFGDWQDDRMKRVRCTPIDINIYSYQRTLLEICNLLFTESTLSVQGDTRFRTTDLRFCCVTVVQRTSSTLHSSALQKRKSVAQNSSGPQVPSLGG